MIWVGQTIWQQTITKNLTMTEKNTQNIPHIGKKLRAARRAQQLSLRELAGRAEVSASLLSKVENGKANPSVRSLHSIADALSIPDITLESNLFQKWRSRWANLLNNFQPQPRWACPL